MFADKKVSFKEIAVNLATPMSEEQYADQVADNFMELEISLTHKNAILKSKELIKLHEIMNKNVDKSAGVVNGNRTLKFFDQNGKRNMADGKRLIHELKLLDLQTRKLMKKAGKDKEEKLKVICIQAMRLFSIHPFNDANKRIVKMMIRHYLEKEFKVFVRPNWQSISRKVINQAVRGNNVGPLCRKICEIFQIKYDSRKITDVELSPYKIFPETGDNIYSMRRELKHSLLRNTDVLTERDPVISREELKRLGIRSTLFKNNEICEDLLISLGADSFLKKVKKYHACGELTDRQAEELVKKLIVITDGADERNCDLATKKLLSTESTDIKSAVNFYEKETLAFEVGSNKQCVDLGIVTQLDITQRMQGGVKM